jgi:anti-sigma regulatory factor (Ser/Thr protein kinase)
MIVTVADQSHLSIVRRAAALLAQTRGFDEQRAGRIGLVATEMATTLVRHAGGGEIGVDGFADGSGTGRELRALDKGQGIARLGRDLEDGFSTAESSGTGLAAIRETVGAIGLPPP